VQETKNKYTPAKLISVTPQRPTPYTHVGKKKKKKKNRKKSEAGNKKKRTRCVNGLESLGAQQGSVVQCQTKQTSDGAVAH